MDTIRRRLTTLLDDTGQTMSEYAMLAGFIMVVVAAAVPGLGSAVLNLYSGVAAAFGG
jgi:Flp pilus assembly pilin Flp